jgi:hypothetical protein
MVKASTPAPVPVPVEHDECGEIGSDDPVTGLPQCILMRKVTTTNAQAIADKVFDTKQNPYEAFENEVTVEYSYILILLALLCIWALVTRGSRRIVLAFAFLLILLLALLQKRDGPGAGKREREPI